MVKLKQVSGSFDTILEELKVLLVTRSVKILEYLTNDVHTFWMLQMRALNQLLKQQLQSPTEGTSQVEVAIRHEGAKLCACIPRVFFLSDNILSAVLELQTPSTAILGRLENAYYTADLTVESDRLVAIFGVQSFQECGLH